VSVLLECNEHYSTTLFPWYGALNFGPKINSAHVDIIFFLPIYIYKLCSLSGTYIFTLTKRQKNIVSSPQHTHTFTNRHRHTTSPLLLSLYLHPPYTPLSLSLSVSLFFSLPLWWQDGQWAESRTPRRTLIMQSLSFLPAPWPWHWPIAVTRGELGTFSLSLSSSTSFSLPHKHRQIYTLLYEPHQTGPPPETVGSLQIWWLHHRPGLITALRTQSSSSGLQLVPPHHDALL